MLFSFRFTCTKAYKNLLNELGDQAGQHEMIAENLSTSVVQELASLVKQLKDDRRKVINSHFTDFYIILCSQYNFDALFTFVKKNCTFLY